ncbi:MAG: lysostaphin resistance A-like protein [Thermoanaerobaculia bacterium]
MTDTAAGSAGRGNGLPARYFVHDEDGTRSVRCDEAPTVHVRVDRGFSATKSAARSADGGTIFLDGAAEGEPFLDVQRDVYNLDHHDGVVRGFTLATCEQAAVLVLRGLDLQAREWTVWANDPDLDTVLAIWVLLNHMRLREEGANVRGRILPLLRLEGCIDVHGLERLELCGFPPDYEREVAARLESLRQREAEVRQTGRWGDIDFPDYVLDLLHRIDDLVYEPSEFTDEHRVEELARAELSNGRFAVACRSDEGVYEAERALRRLYGQRLGVVLLQKDDHTYTVRQVDPFLPSSLARLWEQLNLVDPRAGGRSSGNRWGGSEEIGGSPRKSGSGLTPKEIMAVVQQTFRRPSPTRRLAGVARGALIALGAVAVASTGVSLLRGERLDGLDEAVQRAPDGLFSALFGLFALVGLLLSAERRAGLFGFRRPVVGDWWWLEAPAALVLGLLGGAWVGITGVASAGLVGPGVLTTIALVTGCEVLFRGWIFGDLVRAFGPPRRGPRWRPSPPVWISALLFGLVSILPGLGFASLLPGLGSPWSVVADGVIAALFGLALGGLRERSESLLTPLAVHLAAVLLFRVVAPVWPWPGAPPW